MNCNDVFNEMVQGYQDLVRNFPGDRVYAELLDRLVKAGEACVPDDPFAIEVLDRIWVEKKSNFWADSLMRTAAFTNMTKPPNYVDDDEVIQVARWGDRIKSGTTPMAFIDFPDGGWVDAKGQSVTLESPPQF